MFLPRMHFGPYLSRLPQGGDKISLTDTSAILMFKEDKDEFSSVKSRKKQFPSDIGVW